MLSIKGKTALVTGASSGIGKSAVEMFLDAGVRVYAAARRLEKMQDLEAMGAVVLKMDVTSEESITAGIRTILNSEGSVDILVNKFQPFGKHSVVWNATSHASGLYYFRIETMRKSLSKPMLLLK